MPVSLLTPLAADLAGSLKARPARAFASGVLPCSPRLVIAAVAARMDRKRLLMALTLLMMVFRAAVVALAPNYVVFMLGRALIGVAIGGFWSLSAATAMRLVRAR